MHKLGAEKNTFLTLPAETILVQVILLCMIFLWRHVITVKKFIRQIRFTDRETEAAECRHSLIFQRVQSFLYVSHTSHTSITQVLRKN